MKRKRYTPCPVLVHPTMHPEVPALREQGLVCLGPYHNDKWYIFHPKPLTLCEKICEFIGKHRRG